MELKSTQKIVLGVLVKHKNEWIGTEEIYKECRVNRSHIKSAIKFFMINDYVYQLNIEDKVMVTPNGVDLYKRN